MPNLNAWMGGTPPLANWRDEVDRGYDTARLIAEKPTVITVRRGTADLPEQTVRIESLRLGNTQESRGSSPNIKQSLGMVIVIGYRNHPAEADTDLKRKDRFDHNGQTYDVVQVEPDRDYRLLAYAEISS